MCIKLVYSPRRFADEIPPLGISTISKYLKDRDIDVELEDLAILCKSNKIDIEIFQDKNRCEAYLSGIKDEEIDTKIGKIYSSTKWTDYKLIGFSIINIVDYSVYSTTLMISKLIKEKCNVPIVVGGLTEEMARPLINSKYIDYAVIGSGEEPVYRLYDCIAEEKDIRQIPGLMYIKDNEIKKNNGWYPSETEIMLPDFSGLKMDLYKYNLYPKNTKGMLYLPYRMMLGCPFNCAFCSQSCSKKHWRKKPCQVRSELQYLKEKYNVKCFTFLNSMINPTYDYANKICDEISGLNILWSDSATFQNIDTKLVKKLKKAGATRLIFGFETGSPRLQKVIKKNLDLYKVEQTLKDCKKNGIWTELEIIVGLPTETYEDVEKTCDFIYKNRKNIDNCYLNQFKLEKGSEIYNNPERYGIMNISCNREENIDTKWFQYKYDTSDGLEWEGIVKNSYLRYNKVKKIINQIGCNNLNLQHIFYQKDHNAQLDCMKSIIPVNAVSVYSDQNHEYGPVNILGNMNLMNCIRNKYKWSMEISPGVDDRLTITNKNGGAIKEFDGIGTNIGKLIKNIELDMMKNCDDDELLSRYSKKYPLPIICVVGEKDEPENILKIAFELDDMFESNDLKIGRLSDIKASKLIGYHIVKNESEINNYLRILMEMRFRKKDVVIICLKEYKENILNVIEPDIIFNVSNKKNNTGWYSVDHRSDEIKSELWDKMLLSNIM